MKHSYLEIIKSGFSKFMIVIVFPLLLIAFDGFAIKSYLDRKGEQNAIAGGIIVEATFTDWRRGTSGNNIANSYLVFYKFYDESGMEYFGTGAIVDTTEEAKALLGKPISVYIDGKGHSVRVGKSVHTGGVLALSIVLTTLIVAIIVVVGIFYFRDLKKGKQGHEEETAMPEIGETS